MRNFSNEGQNKALIFVQEALVKGQICFALNVCTTNIQSMRPMSYSSTGTSSSGMKGKVMGLTPARCMCNLPIKRYKV